MTFLWASAGATVRLLPYDVEVTCSNLGNYPLTCGVKATYICAPHECNAVGHIFFILTNFFIDRKKSENYIGQREAFLLYM